MADLDLDDALDRLAATALRIRRERDELLVACKLLLLRQDESFAKGVLPADWGIARETARQAVARAEGRQP